MNRSLYLRFLTILMVAFAGWLVLWPSFTRIAPSWVTAKIPYRLNLGLDIRGGARLSYEVQIGAAIASRRDRIIEGLREQLAIDYGFHSGTGRLTEEASQRLSTKVQFRRSEVDNREFSVVFRTASENSRLTNEMLTQRDMRLVRREGDRIVAALRQDEAEKIERESVEEAVRRIEQRIDALAVRETSITTRGETIVIEIPGSDQAYFDEIRDIIRKTARLEFRMCADSSTFLERFRGGGELAGRIPAGISLESETVSVGQRPDGTNNTATSPYFRAQGPQGRRDLERFIGSIRAEIPETYDLLIGEDERRTRRQTGEVTADQKWWRTYSVEHVAHVTGDQIQSAEVAVRQDTNQPYAALSFKTDGARAFAQITSDNVGRRFAIVLDDLVKSAPVINEAIRNGSASITLGSGDFRSQMREANELSVVLRAGALPAPLAEGAMDFIGPTLGQDIIRKSITAAAMAVGLVMLFMAVWYGPAGWVANGAVLLNILLQISAIAFLGATITLPGLAGLALTVGMAVDANVLINERIKEEQRTGKSLRAAVEAGYQHAFTAIFDGHVTSFISGVVLMQYGTGPIKGFAVMLLIGIVANLFTGVFCTRVVFDWLIRGLKVKSLSFG
ncbi:MAG: protein translocase subunit SecD [Deltaproteobacteria bacterium]|nr:protein translocase subunit SecD [Deltaproteobacteria bacterium]